MDDLLLVIGNYGFPMVVASYLLVRLEPCIRG
ncbi:MAG: YvrJ family protein, partial [Eubacteriales bacterium]|nr:YvrJ family protein [Eubacteriales bacterium]